MPRPILLLLLIALLQDAADAQTAAPPASPILHPQSQILNPASSSGILEQYIRIGLDSNLAIHQQSFDLQKADLDLRRARSLFYPSAGFSYQYTLANGGRSISIPIGDLLNNVYSSLNQLTNSNKFPQVANQSVDFLPNNFQDTKMEITLPILNTDLIHNREVSAEMIHSRKADLDIYRRDLVKNIRQAYYQYLQAGKAVEIYENALSLTQANKRVSEKFVENNMATREIILRAQAQVSQVESDLIGAKNNLRNATAFFNFLLNRPLDAPIQTETEPEEENAFTLQPAIEMPAGREELTKVKSYQNVLSSNLHWDRNYLVPKLSAFYDIGFQGYGVHFDNSQFYQMGGVSLVWPLFKANDNKYKIRQAEIDMAAIGDQYQDLTKRLTLQVQTTANDYYSAVEALKSLTYEVSSAKETYRLTEKRFNEGNGLQIEVIDARTQLTSAELRYSVGRLTVLDRAAELERVTATYKF